MSNQTPQTIGDVIAAELAAVASQAAAAAAAATADAALVAANTSLAAANSQLATDLAAEGSPVFTIDDAGGVTVYITDTSPAGFHSFAPLPASTPLPVVATPPPPTATS
jgi:deoxyxylulose-5-phosphate synthase